ncbi:all trans-polyprenyl-diphosphate synthase PDSS1-like [Macrosteles quadrilineatus]|uniref:all trans-polyprenyl-diphosphate synthase PDSS1-like n=1 Tax=Macrosteles quadrilineatus TaxID=74068 RepID=UPI0023E3333C|nr:all trans-polyprenyl-diphosphate synthase PDSS1-like [Macrosteles quadrilineatus]
MWKSQSILKSAKEVFFLVQHRHKFTGKTLVFNLPFFQMGKTTLTARAIFYDFSLFNKMRPLVEMKRLFSTQVELPADSTTPYLLVKSDLTHFYTKIKEELRFNTSQDSLYNVSSYYFDGKGKAIRPVLIILMARAINKHLHLNCDLLQTQKQVAAISEMIHAASLMHDDVIDQSNLRRGKPSVNWVWNQKQVAMAGDYILAVASMMIARLRNDDVTITLSQFVTDLVKGEFMQLGSREVEGARFTHYLTKSYCKTASLIANSLKAVAILGGADAKTTEIAYEYGRNIGIAFQLVDDLLDFTSSSVALGKPTTTDLKLGLCTAPVLFACEKFPELNCMIMRRFQEPGDVEKALELVYNSDGLDETRYLAERYCLKATEKAELIHESPYQQALIVMCDQVINRTK